MRLRRVGGSIRNMEELEGELEGKRVKGNGEFGGGGQALENR